MSSALDQFEGSLVRASRALHQAGGSRVRADARCEPAAGPRGARRGSATGRLGAEWASRAWQGLRRRPLRAVAGVLTIGALTAAGSTLFGPHGNPRAISSIECGKGSFVGGMTGDPVRDCATLWPSIYHRPAPHLIAWVASTGGAVVVVPAGMPPVGDQSLHWRRLPAGWTQDRATIQLTNQLDDIVDGLQAHPCWSANKAAALVNSTLRADGLASWHLKVKTEPNEGAHPTCLIVDPVVQGDSDSVLLVERHVEAPRGGSFRTPAGALELGRTAAIEKQVNGELSLPGARCVSVSQAAALWRARAHAAGLPDGRYVLFTQSPGAASAGCARIIINAPGGGGPYDVYVVAPL
jgi:hypothetical protein